MVTFISCSFTLQVSEWVVQVIVSQPVEPAGRAVLACMFRLAQVSWHLGNFNGAMEILMGVR